ncbi:glycosyltransferase 25 family member [Homalodisca vitripennis]|uniref:glycosyltransferase 25 family member n=1 Tax=Homalodisca vitripennis TaxID=197043 RepID=UPI001EEB9627|nr:glycosyltransferase 25 family member [Homalodisca vitripennis]
MNESEVGFGYVYLELRMALLQNLVVFNFWLCFTYGFEILTDENYHEFIQFKNKTVVIAILVRNKAHTLPYFLTCLERLDYPKDRLTLWIRSDHNEDNSVEIVERWLSEWAGLYHEVSLEMQPSPPHHLPGELGPAHWPQARYSHIIGLREQALAFGRRSWADYVWFLDSDVFVTNPRTLHQLISKNHVVTAPMLRSDGLYSNFWCGMTDEFYYLRTKDYEPILNRQRSGCFAVPMVHSSVLVSMQTTQADNLHFDPQLVEGYNGPHDDIITFARSANLSGVPLFVCNDQVYGYVMVPLEKDDSLDYDKLQLTNLKVEIMVESYPLPVSDLLESFTSVSQPDTLGVDRVFMINLRRRPERRQRMEQCFAELGVQAITVDAVDGRELTDAMLEEMGITLMGGYTDPYHKRPMKRGEIGCFLSHYSIWKKVVQSGDEVVMVLEDDVRFEAFFRQKVEALLDELKSLALDWDLVYLGRKRLQEQDEVFVPGSKMLVRPNYSYWTLGYLLSQSGARKLLAADPLNSLLPVDEYIPILYDRHTEEKWKANFPVRNLQAFSAEPLLIYPARYLHEEGYVSDTEDSPQVSLPRDDL